ncbi:ABC transporter substrate-binding protein [Propylenella binzhouense]|uniref:Sugar ABC transporter substrate-binding protein n=1 Tax=Propylenella binzhouense TaxID=2555902 RepID=A0A964WTX7_9HYPH|nr:sugar ABC transporter substrate-binding protein [Propylenella binzhouense]MYZ48453.1 sugar ABC transporter substrate-binding protein [Propylenella binzhouense]
MITRRDVLKIGTATAATLACAGLPSAQERTELRVISLANWDERVTSEGLVKPIEAAAPVRLQVERIPFNQLMQALEVRLGARGPDPDVYIVDGPLTASYALRGHLLALDDLIDKKAIAPSAVAACSYKGKQYSAPLANTATVLFYNAALFEKAGIEPPSPDPTKRWTWEHTKEVAKALADASSGVWGLAWDQSERPYEMLPLGQSLGGVALSEDGLTASGYMDSDEFVRAWTFMQSFYNENLSPKGLFDIPVVWELFSTGKLAMMIGLTAGRDTFVKAGVPFGVAPAPYFESGKPVSTTGGWTFGVNPRTEKREASEAFIRALMEPAVQEQFLRSRPYPPFLTALWTRMSDYYSGDMWRIVEYDYANTAVARPSTPGYREYEEILRLALRDIQTGADPKSTLTAAARKTDRELRKYRS